MIRRLAMSPRATIEALGKSGRPGAPRRFGHHAGHEYRLLFWRWARGAHRIQTRRSRHFSYFA